MPLRGKTTWMLEWERKNRRDVRDEIVKLLAAGLTQTQIGRIFGVKPSTVNRALERLEIPPRQWTAPSETAAS